jgi:hypothetical protein
MRLGLQTHLPPLDPSLWRVKLKNNNNNNNNNKFEKNIITIEKK